MRQNQNQNRIIGQRKAINERMQVIKQSKPVTQESSQSSGDMRASVMPKIDAPSLHDLRAPSVLDEAESLAGADREA